MNEGALEIRRMSNLTLSGQGKLVGYGAVFDSPSQDLGGFVEIIKPGAFSRSLNNPEKILALYDHDTRSILGKVESGTLKLSEDNKGLRYEIDLPDTTVGRDLGVLVERGDVSGASFAFTVPKGGDRWYESDGKAHRELVDINLHEITITADPAYLDTSVAKRSMTKKSQWRIRYAERALRIA